MGEETAISWTDKTFNPWWGCTKVGPGCDHCYAETFDKRVGGDHWGTGKPRRLIKDWSGPMKWNYEAEATGARPWVFCASMADVFDNEVPAEWRARLWDYVRETPCLHWQFVTKRIGNAFDMLPLDWAENFGHCGIMSTVVNQDEANRDIPKLRRLKAERSIKWIGLSVEPMLGSMYVTPWLDALDWVIVGGESGHHARPMHPDWARGLRDECAAAGVPFHFKQHGEWIEIDGPRCRSIDQRTVSDGYWMEINGKLVKRSDDLNLYSPYGTSLIAKVGKKRAGRFLDGIEHNDRPKVYG